MMERFVMVGLLFLGTGLLYSGRSFAASIELWTTHSLDKVFPDSGKPTAAPNAIRLKAARNETEDAQIIVRVPKGVEVSRASFTMNDLVGPNGTVLAKETQSAWWVWYTYVLNNPAANTDPSTYLRKAPAFFPDAFLEEKIIRIRDEWTQPLWVSVRAPKGTPPGEYRGSIGIDLVDNQGATTHFDVPVTLTVWRFTLPDEAHLHHTEWFMWDFRYYHVELFSEKHWEWIAKAAQDMARHRQDTILTPFLSLVIVSQDAAQPLQAPIEAGMLHYDFSRLDRWIETFKKAGVTWIEGAHVAGREGGWESNFVWARFPVCGPNGKPVDVSAAKLSEEQFEPYMEGLVKAIHAHLKERGWADRYIQHIADEPIPKNEATWVYRAKRVREWLPGAPIIDAVMSKGLEGVIDIRVPQIHEIKPDEPRNAGETLWSYVCLSPQGRYPNRFLDYPSIRNRILFWLSWTMDLKGFLHWGYNYWNAWGGVPVSVDVSPWMDATGGSIYCADRQPLPAGDPHIVYPGKSQICSSIRWEVVRKGIEDFEYLYLLDQVARSKHSHAKHAARVDARKLLERIKTEIAPNPDNHTHNDQVLLDAREQAGELLDQLIAEE